MIIRELSQVKKARLRGRELHLTLRFTLVSDIFAEVEKQAENATSSRASWRGVLSLNIPTLGLGSVEYHLRAAKAHGDLQPVKFVKVDSVTGKEVISREVPKLFRYKLGPNGERLDVQEIPQEEVKEKVMYGDDYHVFARNERRYFLKEELEVSGKWIEVVASQVIDKQEDGQAIEPFDRTTKIDVEPDGFVPLERLAEYKFKEVYQMAPDTDKKVKETSSRVRQLREVSTRKTDSPRIVLFVGEGLPVLHCSRLSLRAKGRPPLAPDGSERGRAQARRHLGAARG